MLITTFFHSVYSSIYAAMCNAENVNLSKQVTANNIARELNHYTHAQLSENEVESAPPKKIRIDRGLQEVGGSIRDLTPVNILKNCALMLFIDS